MTPELEETLARELNQVADGVQVPPLPSLASADEPRRAVRPWQPLLAAAVVALVVGVVAVGQDGGGEPEPEPSPSPSVTETAGPLTAPTVPYIVDSRLYVDGAHVPGEWWGLQTRQGVWLATQYDGSWWWGGPGIEGAMRIDAQIDQAPAISPNGRYVAFVDVSSGQAVLTGFDTRPAGEGFGTAPIEGLPRSEDGVATRVAAVTDEGDVIFQGTRTQLMWRAQHGDQRTVIELTETAPNQLILQATSAGLVVVNGETGATDATSKRPYLATISAEGLLNPGDVLATYDALDISPGGTWMVRAPAGTLGGEVTSVATLRAMEVSVGTEEIRLDAPEGWGFAVGTWAWEDDQTLVTTLVPDGEDGDARLVRCDVSRGACVALPVPAAE